MGKLPKYLKSECVLIEKLRKAQRKLFSFSIVHYFFKTSHELKLDAQVGLSQAL